MKYYVVLSPTVAEHPSVLPQGRGQKETGRCKREKKRAERQSIRREELDETRVYKGNILKM